MRVFSREEATVTGPGFLLVGVTNYSLGAGETTSLTVRFAPPAAGEAIGMLSVIVYRSGLTKGTGVLSGARRIDVTMSITRIPL